MGSRLEDKLVRELAEQLKPKAAQIWTNKKPSASSRFRQRIEARLGYIPILQPEIDMCVMSNGGKLLAVEVKLFKGDMTFRTPFYEGIGQALALQRYGFDAVALWFLFPQGASTTGINRYGAEAGSFIRNDLNLPLDFSYLSARQVKSRHVFEVMQYKGRQDGYKLLPIDDPYFVPTWRHANPLRDTPLQKALRETLEWYLKIKPDIGITTTAPVANSGQANSSI